MSSPPCLCIVKIRAYSHIHSEWPSLLIHTCSAARYQVPHTPLSNYYCATEEFRLHNKWKPAGGKDVGYEILAFYLARQPQLRANGWLGKKLFRKGWRLS